MGLKSWVASLDLKYVLFRLTGLVGLVGLFIGVWISNLDNWDKWIMAFFTACTVGVMSLQYQTLKEAHKLNEKMFQRQAYPELQIKARSGGYHDLDHDGEIIGATFTFTVVNTGLIKTEISNITLQPRKKAGFLEMASLFVVTSLLTIKKYSAELNLDPQGSTTFELIVLTPSPEVDKKISPSLPGEILYRHIESMKSPWVRLACDDYTGKTHYSPWVNLKFDYRNQYWMLEGVDNG